MRVRVFFNLVFGVFDLELRVVADDFHLTTDELPLFRRVVGGVSVGGAVIVGANAQGKTSILEAVCVLVRLHSPRSLRLGKMVKMAASGFGVAGECWDSERQVRFSSRMGVEMKLNDESVSKQSDYLFGGGLEAACDLDDQRGRLNGV